MICVDVWETNKNCPEADPQRQPRTAHDEE